MTTSDAKEKPAPRWIENLRSLMEARELNARSLSLKAGLNATAVRDMLEGRARFPRYDTVESLAHALDVTPAQLMGSEDILASKPANDATEDDDLSLLTEIIARLQEAAQERRQQLEPRHFAAMVTSIYRHIQPDKTGRKSKFSSLPQIVNQLMSYEFLRRGKPKA